MPCAQSRRDVGGEDSRLARAAVDGRPGRIRRHAEFLPPFRQCKKSRSSRTHRPQVNSGLRPPRWRIAEP